MPTFGVIGAQWGDEGKGKVVDAVAATHVVRFNGGPNAGHTLVIDGKKVVTHNLPSGIAREGVNNLVGPGTICSLEDVRAELAIAKENRATVWLDERCPIILPVHKAIEAGREQALGAGKIGTTGRGIAPCYEDFYARRGPMLSDLVSADRFRAALAHGGYYAERAALARQLGQEPMSLDDTVAWSMPFADLRPYLTDTIRMVHQATMSGDTVLFEGAQGMMLDVMHGGRPYTTSSSCGRGSISNTFGIFDFDRVVGIVKAYTTRVGAGSFPTELTDATGVRLREVGNEFGSTTGRPRRTGWLDLVLLRYACRMGGIEEIAVTKLDVLTGLDEIRVCTGYRHGARFFPDDASITEQVLADAEVIYEILPGWIEDIRDCRRVEDLPKNARHYLTFIERRLGLPISGIGVGPERSEMIWNHPFTVG